MSNRFELESKILDCWNVVDDLNEAIEMQKKGYDLESSVRKISELYQMKFDNLFSLFEKGIGSGNIR